TNLYQSYDDLFLRIGESGVGRVMIVMVVIVVVVIMMRVVMTALELLSQLAKHRIESVDLALTLLLTLHESLLLAVGASLSAPDFQSALVSLWHGVLDALRLASLDALEETLARSPDHAGEESVVLAVSEALVVASILARLQSVQVSDPLALRVSLVASLLEAAAVADVSYLLVCSGAVAVAGVAVVMMMVTEVVAVGSDDWHGHGHAGHRLVVKVLLGELFVVVMRPRGGDEREEKSDECYS
ncbi:hypothetical protein PMAYCL1PPCAC_32535, partial [Pristionchus mayeri]